ncbi:MAG: hypothetical protein WC919_07190 [Candidatus Paceibacterota bacterium]|jgi:hypothetical protein
MVQLDENKRAEIVVPLCPWCEEPLCGRTDGGLHETCAAELSEVFHDATL